MNPRTARSQLMGGMIWGISSALHEETEIDIQQAKYVNDNLADYLIPVNADVEQVDVILLSEEDNKLNPASVKGLGELGNVGTAAAISNAVNLATGIRIRELASELRRYLTPRSKKSDRCNRLQGFAVVWRWRYKTSPASNQKDVCSVTDARSYRSRDRLKVIILDTTTLATRRRRRHRSTASGRCAVAA